ncbi:MAG: VOC family protein [Anaerolineae bacterium]|nr:VOC family protein [Anaerolineae bacterium]
MQQIIAELTVEDVEASINWYKELGFEVEIEGVHDDQGVQWVSMGRDGRSVWLLREDISRHAVTQSPCRVTFYLQVEDVDEVYHHLVNHHVQTHTKPQNQWYGLRDFIAYDPDGFCWAINQSIPPSETPPHPTLGRHVGLLQT